MSNSYASMRQLCQARRKVKMDSYFVRTIETASFRMLSPNTNMFRTGSTLSALKMAMVATGSTAEMSEPKAKLQQEKGHFK